MPKHNLPHGTVAPIGLPVDRIDVWTVSLVVEPERVASLAESLSADERERAGRFKFDDDRRRFAVGRGALRGILAAYLGSAPADIRFDYSEQGKPRLAGSSAAERSLEFNVSGSRDLAVCAVTVGRTLGVDIERIRLPHDEAVVDQCFALAERQAYHALAEHEKTAAFYRLWTCKEAYLKATGAGLSRPLSSFEVACPPGQPPCLTADHLLTTSGNDWNFIEFQPAPTHAGAIVIFGDPRPLQPRRWSP